MVICCVKTTKREGNLVAASGDWMKSIMEQIFRFFVFFQGWFLFNSGNNLGKVSEEGVALRRDQTSVLSWPGNLVFSFTGIPLGQEGSIQSAGGLRILF